MATHNLILKPGDILNATVENVVTPPANIPPLASAGPDVTIKLPVSEVTLVGAVSDPDGLASDLTVKWSGPGTIVSPNAISTKVTGLTEGTHTFRLTVTDKKGAGLSTADDVTITVLKADPVVTPGKVDYMNLPTVGVQDFSGKSNVVFEGKRIVNAGDVAVKLYNGANNITIRNCFFDGGAKELVELENAKNVLIENCLFAKSFAGVYAVGSSNVTIRNCQFVNMKIRWINGNFSGRGVFVQFNGCNSVEVSGCKGENFPEADPEDMISMYKTSNAVIKNNIFRGNPQSNWSASGGGIIGGDNGGDNILIEGNTLMTPGNYGVALAGGSNSKILNNKIYSERNPVSNNPLYTWGQGVPLSNITVSGNKVYWIDKNGAVNRGWNAGGTNVNYNPAENGTITKAEMNVPDHLIDFVTPAELLKIRGK